MIGSVCAVVFWSKSLCSSPTALCSSILTAAFVGSIVLVWAKDIFRGAKPCLIAAPESWELRTGAVGEKTHAKEDKVLKELLYKVSWKVLSDAKMKAEIWQKLCGAACEHGPIRALVLVRSWLDGDLAGLGHRSRPPPHLLGFLLYSNVSNSKLWM